MATNIEGNVEISFNVRKNMTFSDYVRSHYFQLINPLETLQRYRKVFKNYLHVLLNHYRNNYPIEAVLKNGGKIIFSKRFQTKTSSLGIENYCHFQNNVLTIKKDNLPEVNFVDSEENGDLFGVFFKEEYNFLPVKNQVVIDIGANIGDSAIYFALKGARKIIAIEPIQKNYDQAQTNIKLNNFTNKIVLINAGISDKNDSIKINLENSGTTCFLEKDDNNGIEVPLVTLEDILKINDNNDCLLKMDCEGYEYRTILSTPNKILQKFSHIQIEYHFGYKNLKKKLEDCGFKVTVEKPHIGVPLLSKKIKSYCGFLYAERVI